MAMYYSYYTSYGIDHVITAAFKDFKVHKVQEEMGFSYLGKDGESLRPFKGKVFDNKEAYFMYLEDMNFPEEFISKISFLKKYWNSRLNFTEDELNLIGEEVA